VLFRSLLITGGTGSFGNAVLNKFLKTSVKEIRVFSRDEKKQNEMRLRIKNDKVKFYIGDVRDLTSVTQAVKGTDYIFHAAALKQVPSCEFYPIEAVKTNILGANNVLNAAEDCGVKNVIVLSTDKAVYPINVMGLSKALMEKVMIAKSRLSDSITVFCGTRYGNVMGSRGSVIPLFIEQIIKGDPITITDPQMTRFMMSLDDAVELVLYAFKNGQNGDIFVQKTPASTIKDIAEALKEIFKSNSKIKIIGTRHGEKKHETLISNEEMRSILETKYFYRITADVRDLNYHNYYSKGEKQKAPPKEYNSLEAKRLSHTELVDLLLKQDFVRKNLENRNSLVEDNI